MSHSGVSIFDDVTKPVQYRTGMDILMHFPMGMPVHVKQCHIKQGQGGKG